MQDVPPKSFTDLYADVGRRRESGDVDGAVALLRENVKTFPLHRGVVYLVLAEALVANGQPKEALDALQEAFTVGCRYKGEWLTADPNLAPLVNDPRFIKIVKKVDERYKIDAAAARSDLLVRAPAGDALSSGRPLLVALHGNNSNARETARYWSSAVQDGWVVAIPQSSEIGASPDAFTWNDRARAIAEIAPHIARVKELHRIDEKRIVLAGFSMGGLQAIALPLVLGFDVRGMLPIAAWLPNLDELRPLVEAGAGSDLRAYMVMGEEDPSFGSAMELAGLLQKHKAKVKLDARPGVGHEYPTDMEATLSRALVFLAGVG
jgi:predicted esterase